MTATLACSRLGLGVLVASLISRRDRRCRPPPRRCQAADSYSVTGYGYGHGHGLSQYGAQGAANQGLGLAADHRLLLPRHSRSVGPAEPSRCCFTADKKDVVVDARAGLRLHPAGRAQDLPARPGAAAGHPVADPAERAPRASSPTVPPAWGAGPVVDRPPGAAQFAAGNKPLTLRLSNYGPLEYRGALRSVEKHTVNVLSLDSYVRGVVPREVPAEWPADAVRAQAVAARTYAAFERRDRDVVLRHLRHQLLPGLRRRRRPSTRPPTLR